MSGLWLEALKNLTNNRRRGGFFLLFSPKIWWIEIILMLEHSERGASLYALPENDTPSYQFKISIYNII